ncbi:hypothetical protein M413DRAFT_32743 [Hebeloma cylindrosporum]|uniref:Uncharacterized protein n=1 Tax=Hebeloma cylindrosporum TaxID=76867 RepID=A0A0C3BED1_HEBCY|nr:hypothetical protein M413DRAFT_32743 [Hebeloma cylindrosporum h7]
MNPIIAQHLPLITNRVSFTLNPPLALPSLTTRHEFDDELAIPRNNPKPSTLPGKASALKYSNSVTFFGARTEMAGKQDPGKGVEVTEVQEESTGEEEIVTLITKPPGEPGRPAARVQAVAATVWRSFSAPGEQKP